MAPVRRDQEGMALINHPALINSASSAKSLFLNVSVIILNQDGATSVWADLKHQGKIEAQFISLNQAQWEHKECDKSRASATQTHGLKLSCSANSSPGCQPTAARSLCHLLPKSCPAFDMLILHKANSPIRIKSILVSLQSA